VHRHILTAALQVWKQPHVVLSSRCPSEEALPLCSGARVVSLGMACRTGEDLQLHVQWIRSLQASCRHLVIVYWASMAEPVGMPSRVAYGRLKTQAFATIWKETRLFRGLWCIVPAYQSDSPEGATLARLLACDLEKHLREGGVTVCALPSCTTHTHQGWLDLCRRWRRAQMNCALILGGSLLVAWAAMAAGPRAPKAACAAGAAALVALWWFGTLLGSDVVQQETLPEDATEFHGTDCENVLEMATLSGVLELQVCKGFFSPAECRTIAQLVLAHPESALRHRLPKEGLAILSSDRCRQVLSKWLHPDDPIGSEIIHCPGVCEPHVLYYRPDVASWEGMHKDIRVFKSQVRIVINLEDTSDFKLSYVGADKVRLDMRSDAGDAVAIGQQLLHSTHSISTGRRVVLVADFRAACDCFSACPLKALRTGATQWLKSKRLSLR